MASEIITFADVSPESIQVDKNIELKHDLGTLLSFDTNDLDEEQLRSNTNAYLKELARDDTQLLLNAIWELPTDKVENVTVAKLPKPTYVLPREKRLPKPKTLTKWQQFAKEKGIQPKKKKNLDWDETLKKWVPRYGYQKSKAEKEKNWVIEVPGNVDPYTDMFEKKAALKQEKVSKNEFQRLRNLAKANNIKVPSMGLAPTPNPTSKQLNTAAQVANVSTASLGKFQPRLSREKLLSKESILQKRKRKLPPPSKEDEFQNNMKIANSILNKKPRLDLDKAANREIFQQERAVSENKRSKGKGKGKSGKGERKPKAGKGNRSFKKGRTGGRKRR